jgi:hypothetical protein
MRIRGYAILHAGGAITQVCANSCPSMRDMQELVGGWTEHMIVPHSLVEDGETDLVVNEEGPMIGLPYNHNASQLALMKVLGTALLFTGGLRLP